MEIVELDMKKYLGRGIHVFLMDGESRNFLPMELINGNKWRGLDDESNVITIRKESIMFVKAPIKNS